MGLATGKMSIPKQESVEFFGRKSFSCYIYRRNWQWERVISLNTNNSVYINIYTNLSEAHVLSLSYQQNELHQISQKEFSFLCKSYLSHSLYEEKGKACRKATETQFYEMGALSLTNLFGFCLPVHT